MRVTPQVWWAIGRMRPTGWFDIRRLVVGRLLAREEKREGEVIRKVRVTSCS